MPHPSIVWMPGMLGGPLKLFIKKLHHVLRLSGSLGSNPCIGQGGLVVRSSLWGRRGSKPDSTEDPQCIEPAARQIMRKGQNSYRWCGAEVWRWGC
ncbi:hypothetical protein AVEN_59132-1 [Araneus ventricosus]|uniref:Uncharacterized protein n=1 Tax=Araneus ventricosus TaxID=182803 RepID=A0A4Y2V5S0_ARAVE|nr:hypothetical protein AVEN_36376-1 [Araneus ventricosus]GBO19901.1 hypothetical protein AVEN_59132-1 [Araneus ventricosus]